ncbi:O-linked N-acetylglucosamine transferase, SPINDLY family protein [Hyphomicrobium sp. DMF-1]|uniref:O-linked N-acetylglucosamine transferase, SPINDLY family protein n=1 Tax=Hyphomicrobium sp. DMF-1 TaxID=3019544 RepID=UPI0022EBFCC6|nr:tetratricopeptide repeat protein [Hyphomicrobium sp. DMF-1]WBT38303.1 tetratricopeptide repeat protein [Hyphomicrobium sp. DMF-1]
MQRQPVTNRETSDGQALLQRAMEALDRGDVRSAAVDAQRAAEITPDEALAWEILSLALHRGGAIEQAIVAGRRAVALKPDAADFQANLGVVLRAAGRTEEAAAAYRAALAADPKFAPAHNNLGNIARDAGQFVAAEASYRNAVASNPSYAEAWHGLGVALQRQNKPAEAEKALERAAELRPDRADILSDLAATAMALQKFNEASALLDKAVATDPNSAIAFGNLGALKLRIGHMVAAGNATARAMELAPNEQRWVSNLGVIRKDLSLYSESESLFRRALSLKPDYALAHANLLFCLNYHPDRSAEEIFAEYERFDAAHARPHRPAEVSFANDRSPDRKLRVGFLSPDFREHAARHFLDPLLRHLDREKLEIVCYAEVTNEDHVTQSFKAMSNAWRSTVGLTDDEVAAQIRSDRIDILVDFGGHTSSSRILAMARKPAPIQVAHHLGHGYTSGMSAIDVFLSDGEMAPVGSEHLFSEKIVRLSRIPVAYQPPEGMPEVGPLPALRNGYVTFGYFGRPERINDRVVKAWSEILLRVPNSRLMLNSKAFSEAAFSDLMASRFAVHGVGRDRLVLVYTSPQPKTWAAYGKVDIALDPFPHNAGTTTIEALWLGVPVVSVADRPSVGRFGASNLGAVGLRDWVAGDVASYVALAAAKASDVASLAALRAGLRARVEASPLADGPGLARDLETAFRKLWKEWCGEAAPKAPQTDREPVLQRRAAATREIARLEVAGRLADAAACIVKHLSEDPADIDSGCYLSDVQRRLGRLTDAEATARAVLKAKPRHAAANNALGNALSAQQRLREAEDAFSEAIAAKPDHAEAFNNRALVLMRRGQLVAAERDLRQALALRPDLTEIGFNLANSLQDQGRVAEAIEIFQATLAKAPGHPKGHGMMLFAVTYHPGLTGDQIFAEFRRWSEVHADRHAPKNCVWPNDRTPGRRLRVGYVSPDFATKSSRHFIEPILVGHDRSKVEIFCYAEVPAPDAETHRLKALAEHWRGTVGLSDDELANLIRRDAIDVLVDLGGHTARNRLLTFARKPAPVQVAHFLGHGYTSGLSVMDAFLADDELAPPGSDHLFSEPVERLPRMPVAYQPPQGMPDVTALPALANGYITFGNFGRAVRLNDEVIATWSEILKRVPRSRLVLNTVAFVDEEVCRRYRDLFAGHGISADRIDLVFTTPQPKTWEAYGTIDIALDPFPHNGGTTTIEAAWLGVPSICLKTRPSVGCFGATIMGSLGLSDWVAISREEYIAKAIARATDIEALAALRAGLRARMAASPLCDARGLATELERVYERLWLRYVDREEAVETLQRAAGWAYGRGNIERAIELFQEAAKRSQRADTMSNLGAAYRAAGRNAEAEAAYREAIARAPGFANAHGNLGNLLAGRGRLAEAESELRKACTAAPNDPQILRNLGLCLMRQLKASEAEVVLRKAAELMPNDGDIHDNLAQLLRQKGEPVAAVKVYLGVKDAIANNWRALGNQALLLQDLSLYSESESLFRRALSLKPDYALAHANLLFCLNYHPDRSAEEIFAEYERFDAAHARPHRPAEVSFANDRSPDRKLRVGFLSPDFREHAARHFLDPLLRHLDREKLEIVCYAEVTNEDHVTQSFKAMSNAWRSTVGLTDDEVAAQIRSDRIDILVDFGGHTSSSRILAMARKPAPIQVAHHLGHGYTSGMSAIDVFLSDGEMAPVGSEHLFSEKIVRLSRIPVAYQPPEGMPEVGPLPALRNGYVTFGYFGRPERINDRVVKAWSEILLRVPNSRLMLNSKAFSEAAFSDLMASRFAVHGVGRDRLVLVYTSPQPKTWAAYGKVDIALDPFPHNAGTTTIEALWLGVPVVSVADRPSVGRFGASNLGAVGLRDWVAGDVASYVALAAAKASDVASLAALRAGLRARVEASPLADGPGLARDLETAFRKLWKEWCGEHRKRDMKTIRAAFEHAVHAFQSRDFERSLALASAVLFATPEDVEARHLRGIAAFKLGRLSEAVEDLADAIRAMPERADFRWNITPMLRMLGRLPEAEVQGREAVRLAPTSPEAHNNLATVYKDMGRAAEAEAHLRHALTLKPDYSDAWSNLSWTLSLAGNAREAEAAARRAFELNPRDSNALNNIGTALMQQDRLPEAADCFAQAVALKPDFAIAHSNYLFCLNYRTDLSPEKIFEAYQAWDRAHAAPLRPANPSYLGSRDPGRPLRIGYVSPDFRYHAVSFFIESLLASHDQSRYEVTCYAEVANPDAVTERFKRHATRWRSTVGLSDADLAELIRNDGIDILVDLAGHTSGNRLLTFARKPAPIQVAHMVGSGTTTGLTAIDAFLINEALLPMGAERYFSERPIRLSRMPHVYVPPEGMPDVAPLPALKNGFVTFGCFSRPARINEDVIKAWVRILKSVPNSRLVLNSKPFREEENCIAWHARFADLGLEPGRVKLVYTSPQPRTWEAYSTIDIALDPFPHNAGTTTIEALWLGVPVVSLAGRPPVGRFGASILGSVGLDDWVTHDIDSYVARAATAASNVTALARLRASLRDKFKASPIGADSIGLAREVEAAYRGLWKAYCTH